MIYRLSNIIQGLLWLFGMATHNKIADECCPDFSCCCGKITPFKGRVRELFFVWAVRPLKPLYFKIFHPRISQTRLCSGYRIFPDGSSCPGCLDCYNTRRANP